jgi:hypothetical protein
LCPYGSEAAHFLIGGAIASPAHNRSAARFVASKSADARAAGGPNFAADTTAGSLIDFR